MFDKSWWGKSVDLDNIVPSKKLRSLPNPDPDGLSLQLGSLLPPTFLWLEEF